MIYSCLVDADFLDTESFMDPACAAKRPEWPSDILSLMESALDHYISGISSNDTIVDRERTRVRNLCLEAANRTPGLFSLTVPTGGGKTLSSLAFALRHAIQHNLKRVIYVIPFTSIIEQNAAVFRNVFRKIVEDGTPDPVLEHHCSMDAGSETYQNRLATENWDAPLIATTSVQFYESVFASRTSRCRKLHNLARSVIILDEAQKIPVDYLHPCLLAIRELASNYDSTVVLCTATQPAINLREDFEIGLKDIREIIDEPQDLYLNLKRVSVEEIGNQKDEDLAARLVGHDQALCVVNTRRHARILFSKLNPTEGLFHLSAAMCPAHRSAVMNKISKKLEKGHRCIVISTQLVEAGVDLDFPVVYRSLAGLDSIIQAAGRCNRNGRQSIGTTFVFRSEHKRSEGFLAETANATMHLIGGPEGDPLYEDLTSLDAIEHFFRLYYWSQNHRWDSQNILDDLKLVSNNRDLPFQFAFRTIAQNFRFISDTGMPIIIPWQSEISDEGRRLCDQLANSTGIPAVPLLRMLQRYTVQVRNWLFDSELGRNIDMIHDRYPILINPELHYDSQVGLVLDKSDFETEQLII
jgi:CRISPR-associated endonuclease/helicase Cas3